MGFHPLNLGLRFLLEVAAVAGVFRLGLWLADGLAGVGLAVVLSVIALVVWSVFNVPGDRSRSGKAPVRVSGKVRLLTEIVVLGAGAWSWFVTGPRWFAVSFLVGLVLHYTLSWDRLAWLLRVDSDGVDST